jgi:arylsulfatase A-like enzyme
VLLGAAASAAPAKPDFCVILVDSLRADHLGCYERNTLPTVDAFAARHAAATVAGR